MATANGAEIPALMSALDEMVAALRADPRVEVYEYVVRPPASRDELRRGEQAIGCALPPDLARFYSLCDGVFLEWGLRGRAYERTPAFGYPDYGAAPGCINLLPVHAALSAGWEQDCHVNAITEEHQQALFGAPVEPELDVTAICVDNFSRYHHGDLVLGPDPVMVVSTDHGADMDSSDFLSFRLYLEMTVALYGVNRYEHGVGIGWSRASQRVTAWTKRPSLDALVEALIADED